MSTGLRVQAYEYKPICPLLIRTLIFYATNAKQVPNFQVKTVATVTALVTSIIDTLFIDRKYCIIIEYMVRDYMICHT